jgi:hypothetical protein
MQKNPLFTIHKGMNKGFFLQLFIFAAHLITDNRMKITFLNIGCWGLLLCFFGCGKTDGVSLTGISVSPATVQVDAGKTLDLAATITPSDATEDVFWFSLDQNIITIDSRYGIQTRLNAISPGTTVVYATNRTKTVVSEDIVITVNSVDFVRDVLGDYVGSGSLTFPIMQINEQLSDVNIKFERAYNEAEAANYIDRAKVTIRANTQMMGLAVITGERTLVSSAYDLKNDGNLRIEGVTGASFDELTGKVNPAAKTLSLRLFMNNGLTIELTAAKQE